MAEPIYWEDLQWQFGWDEQPKRRALVRQSRIRGMKELVRGKGRIKGVPKELLEMQQAFRQGVGFESAWLDSGHEVFRSIRRYLKANAIASPQRAPQGERTRMERAATTLQTLLQDPNAPQAQVKIKAQLVTLSESKDYIRRFQAEFAQYGVPTAVTKPQKSGAVEISRIRVIKHPDMWESYESARERIGAEIESGNKAALTTGDKLVGRSSLKFTTKDSISNLPILDADIGELLLMHGTSGEVVKLIAKSGFDPARNKGTQKGNHTEYGALGQGTYFGDSFAKVQTYSGCPLCTLMKCDCEDEDGEPLERYLILARCMVGIPTKVRTHGELGTGKRTDSVDVIKAGKHSVVAQKGSATNWTLYGANEFLLKDAAQMYPEFVVMWRPA